MNTEHMADLKIQIGLQAQEIVDALLRRRPFRPVAHPEIWNIRYSNLIHIRSLYKPYTTAGQILEKFGRGIML